MDAIIMFWGIIVYIYRLIPKVGIFTLYFSYLCYIRTGLQVCFIIIPGPHTACLYMFN